MRRLLSAAAATTALALLAAAAGASIVLRVSPRELADTANLVVEGRVAAVDVRWDAGRTCINTYVTFTVERVHKGTAPGSVTVKVPGGRVGEEEVRVEGTAKFERDEQAMLFLWKDREGEWLVLGEAQGKFRLWQDEKAAKRMAANSLRGLCLVLRGDPGSAAADAARRPDTLPYDDLAAVVKASVDASAKAAPAKGGGGARDGTGKGTGAAGTATPGSATGPGAGGGTAPPPAPASGGTSTTVPPTGATPPAGPVGRDPAPPGATPDPPSSTTGASSGGAPPPSKDAPAPRAGSSDTPGAGQQPPPAPEKK